MMPSGRAPLGHSRRYALAALGLACLAGGAWFAWRDDRGRSAQGAAALELFLSAQWKDAEGRPFDASGLRGRPLVINFWATWCPPCVEEMPELDALSRELSPKGIQVVGIGIDSSSKIEQFARKAGFSYPLLQAGAGGAELTRAFGNESAALPYTVVVARDGGIRQRILGRFKLEALRRSALSAAG